MNLDTAALSFSSKPSVVMASSVGGCILSPHFPVPTPCIGDQGGRTPRGWFGAEKQGSESDGPELEASWLLPLDERVWNRTKYLQGSHGLRPDPWASPVPPRDTSPGDECVPSAQSPSRAMSSLVVVMSWS